MVTLMCCCASPAVQAGGFQRAQPDIGLLFAEDPRVLQVSFTQVVPRRNFETINGERGDYGRITPTIEFPAYAFKAGGDRVACAGAYIESFGGNADYRNLPGGLLPAPLGNPLGSRTRNFSFHSNEASITCRLSYRAGKARWSVLGGLYAEDFNVDFASQGFQNLTALVAAANPLLASAIAPGSGSPLAGTRFIAPVMVSVDADSRYKVGWRLGAAYEIPEIALRAQVIYRASIKHDNISGTGSPRGDAASFARLADGTTLSLQQFGALLPVPGVGDQLASALPGDGTVLPATSAGLNTITSPASLTIDLQTGIAPGTLLFGSLRWTDWSTLDSVIVSIDGVAGSLTPFRWRDGVTANIGLGRELSARVAAAVSVGYDRGVGKGADAASTDAYTLNAGIKLKQGMFEWQLGGMVGYLKGGEQTIADGALFNASLGSDWVTAVNATMRVGF